MNQTLYVPAFSAVAAEHKARVFEGCEPFYWRDSKAAHDIVGHHYGNAIVQPVVFAVTRRADGTLQVREHIQLGPEHAIDPRPLTVGDVLLALGAITLAMVGIWLVGQGSLQ